MARDFDYERIRTNILNSTGRDVILTDDDIIAAISEYFTGRWGEFMALMIAADDAKRSLADITRR